jgi:hypothetical protein
LGYFNPQLKRSDPHRTTDRWQFCSMRCQDAFARLIERTEGQMIDPTEMEMAAMKCLPGAAWRLCRLPSAWLARWPTTRKAEVLRLVEVVVDAYQAHMIEEHERLAAKERAYFEARLSSQPASSGGLR